MKIFTQIIILFFIIILLILLILYYFTSRKFAKNKNKYKLMSFSLTICII